MLGFKTACQCLLATCLIVFLSGCKTVDSRVATIRENITSINLGSLWDQKRSDDNNSQIAALDAPETIKEEDPTLELLAFDNVQCPNIQIVDDLNILYDFSDMTYPKDTEIVSGVTIKDYSSECKNKENNVIVKLNIEFEGELGPLAKTQPSSADKHSYPYFVAITSSQGGILAKEVFALNLEYDDNSAYSSKIERLDQIIPIAKDDSAENLEILIGFQLSDTQLAYNRQLGSSLSEMLAQTRSLSGIEPAAGTADLNLPENMRDNRKASQPPQRLDELTSPDNNVTIDSYRNENTNYYE